MLIIKDPGVLAVQLQKLQETHSIGFVPTMGALHQGHLALVNACLTNNEVCVCSIFVNPTQFNDQNDFINYPNTIAADLQKLEEAGCALVFTPLVKDMYPKNEEQQVYAIGELENLLEGKYRPGHYQGVNAIVDKLLTLVKPATLYLGQKDYQQCMVLQNLICQKHTQVNLQIVPTKREPSGLAMSSRNARLSADEKIAASAIYRNLALIKNNIAMGQVDKYIENAGKDLTKAGFKIDYLSIADSKTLAPVESWDGTLPITALVAATIGNVRLIDNLQIYP